MAIFITWEETQKELAQLRYIGGGITVADMKEIKVTRKARYSNENTPEMMRRAKEYIKTDMQAQPTAKVIILDE